MNKSQSVGIWIVVILLTLSLGAMLFPNQTTSTQDISYSQFLGKVANGEISSVQIDKDTVTAKPKNNEEKVQTERKTKKKNTKVGETKTDSKSQTAKKRTTNKKKETETTEKTPKKKKTSTTSTTTKKTTKKSEKEVKEND